MKLRSKQDFNHLFANSKDSFSEQLVACPIGDWQASSVHIRLPMLFQRFWLLVNFLQSGISSSEE